MIGASILDGFGVIDADRAEGCIMLCAEVAPDGLTEDDLWIPPSGKARVLAMACAGEPAVLDLAIRLTADALDRHPDVVDRGHLPAVSFAQALVVLRKARRLLD